MLPSAMQNLQRLITSNLGDKTLTLHPLPNHPQFIINPLLCTYSFKINSSSRVQSPTTTHAVHQSNGSLEHEELARPIVNYDPNSWGDRFLNCTLDDEITQAIRKEEAERLKVKMKEQLLVACSDQLQWLSYVNTLELLGVAYHFNNEIDEGLLHIHKNYNSWDEEENLYHISLGFRLLRQHGFHVPSALAKANATLTMIDDIYDGYGTIEELELFTQAFERWDKSFINQLPNYMRSIYTSHLDVYEEVEKVLAKEGRSNCIEHIQEAMKVIIRAYFQDAKWRLAKYNPTYEECLANAIKSIAYMLASTFCFIFLGEIATVEVFEWTSQFPKALEACSGITRLLNDMSTPSQQRDGMLSTIITYMKHFNVSKEEAIEELCKQVDDFWKDLNQEMLQPNVVRMPIITCLVRLARSAEITWRDGYDSLTVVHQCYKDDIEKAFIEPFPI